MEIVTQAQYSKCNIELDRTTNVIAIPCLSVVHHQDAGKKCTSQSQLKPMALFAGPFIGHDCFILYGGLSHTYIFPALCWLAQENITIYYFRKGSLHKYVTHCTSKAKVNLYSFLCWD